MIRQGLSESRSHRPYLQGVGAGGSQIGYRMSKSDKFSREARKIAREQNVKLSVAKRILEDQLSDPQRFIPFNQPVIKVPNGLVAPGDLARNSCAATVISTADASTTLESVKKAGISAVVVDLNSSGIHGGRHPVVEVDESNVSKISDAIRSALSSGKPLTVSLSDEELIEELFSGLIEPFPHQVSSVLLISGAERLGSLIDTESGRFLLRMAREYTPVVVLDGRIPGTRIKGNLNEIARKTTVSSPLDMSWSPGIDVSSGERIIVNTGNSAHTFIIGGDSSQRNSMVQGMCDQLAEGCPGDQFNVYRINEIEERNLYPFENKLTGIHAIVVDVDDDRERSLFNDILLPYIRILRNAGIHVIVSGQTAELFQYHCPTSERLNYRYMFDFIELFEYEDGVGGSLTDGREFRVD